jgi:hypothetical protein
MGRTCARPQKSSFQSSPTDAPSVPPPRGVEGDVVEQLHLHLHLGRAAVHRLLGADIDALGDRAADGQGRGALVAHVEAEHVEARGFAQVAQHALLAAGQLRGGRGQLRRLSGGQRLARLAEQDAGQDLFLRQRRAAFQRHLGRRGEARHRDAPGDVVSLQLQRHVDFGVDVGPAIERDLAAGQGVGAGQQPQLPAPFFHRAGEHGRGGGAAHLQVGLPLAGQPASAHEDAARRADRQIQRRAAIGAFGGFFAGGLALDLDLSEAGDRGGRGVDQPDFGAVDQHVAGDRRGGERARRLDVDADRRRRVVPAHQNRRVGGDACVKIAVGDGGLAGDRGA